jgi:hypothetical protein
MAFGWAGGAAGGAQGLEEIVAQRMLAQKLEAEIANRQKQTELEQAALNQRSVEHSDNMRSRQRDDDRLDGAQRDRNNSHGVRKMIGESLMQGGEPDRRALAAMQIEAGDAPTMLNEPKPERDPIADYEARKKLDRQYDRPAVVRPERDPIADHEAKLKLDAKYKTGQATGPTPYAKERSARTLQSVDELMGKVSGKTSGWGNLAAGIPASDAMNFSSELDTLKANIAFNELTAMREASKTGGALGQVSNVELRLLESALGALNPRQSPENLKAQLSKIKESIGRWQQATGVEGGMPAMAPAPSHGEAPAPQAAPSKRFTITKVGG